MCWGFQRENTPTTHKKPTTRKHDRRHRAKGGGGIHGKEFVQTHTDRTEEFLLHDFVSKNRPDDQKSDTLSPTQRVKTRFLKERRGKDKSGYKVDKGKNP